MNVRVSLKPATDKGTNNHLNQTVLCCLVINIKPWLQYQTDVRWIYAVY